MHFPLDKASNLCIIIFEAFPPVLQIDLYNIGFEHVVRNPIYDEP